MNIEDEENIEVSPNLKKILVSEVDLIRDAFSVMLVFVEGAAKAGIRFIETNENNNTDEPTS